jgi:hypothetical protein
VTIEPNEKKARVSEALLGCLHEAPREISVPRFTRWVGLQPIPQDDYRVEYHNDAANIFGRVGNFDQRLFGLHRRVRIEVDLAFKVAHVFLDPSKK